MFEYLGISDTADNFDLVLVSGSCAISKMTADGDVFPKYVRTKRFIYERDEMLADLPIAG